jgi:hypothetical protein
LVCHFLPRRLGRGFSETKRRKGVPAGKTGGRYCITELVILAAVVIWNAMVISSNTIYVETEGEIERCCATWGSAVTWCLIRERKN